MSHQEAHRQADVGSALLTTTEAGQAGEGMAADHLLAGPCPEPAGDGALPKSVHWMPCVLRAKF